MEESKEVLKSVIVGIVVLSIAECIVGTIVSGDFVRFFLGCILGSVAGGAYIIDMYKTLDIALDMDEEGASGFSRKRTARRMFGVAVVLALGILLNKVVSVLAVFLGVMNVKFAVYLYPLTNKLIKYFNKGR